MQLFYGNHAPVYLPELKGKTSAGLHLTDDLWQFSSVPVQCSLSKVLHYWLLLPKQILSPGIYQEASSYQQRPPLLSTKLISFPRQLLALVDSKTKSSHRSKTLSDFHSHGWIDPVRVQPCMKVKIRVKEVVLLGSAMGGLGCRANCGGEPCAVPHWVLLSHTARYRITRTLWDENGLLLPLPNTGMAFVGWSLRRAGGSDVDLEHQGGLCSLPLSAKKTPAPPNIS